MKLWCVGFNEFENLAKRNGWHLEVPSNIAIISINNGKDASTDTEYHICEDDVNVLNLNFDDVDPMALGLSDDTETYTYEKVWIGVCTEELFLGRDYQIIIPPFYGRVD